MLKYTLLLIILLTAGCATHPKPAEKTNYCAKGETVNCRPWTPTESTGAGSRGHSNDKPQYQMYVPPEEIWPDEYQTAPKVCASPFRGSILQR